MNLNKILDGYLLNSGIDETKHNQLIKDNNGKRCFILGNGPSLNNFNFNLIKNETTIACNFFLSGIHERKNNFIPTILCGGDIGFEKKLLTTDFNILNKKQPILILHPSNPCFFKKSSTYNNNFNKIKHNYAISNFPKFTLQKSLNIGLNKFRQNRQKYCVIYRNVIPMISMLIAYKLGFTKMYFLGIDLDNVINHFYKFKSHTNKSLKKYPTSGYKNIHKGFKIRYDQFQKIGITMINYNPNSCLNILPKKDPIELFNIIYISQHNNNIVYFDKHGQQIKNIDDMQDHYIIKVHSNNLLFSDSHDYINLNRFASNKTDESLLHKILDYGQNKALNKLKLLFYLMDMYKQKTYYSIKILYQNILFNSEIYQLYINKL